MYHVSVHPLAESVLASIREQELLKPGIRAGIAVSGGADSVGLLCLMLELRAELGVFLSVAHFNHQLRGAESDSDESFVAELAHRCGLQFFSGAGDVRAFSAREGLSTEAAAREMRYEFFRSLIGEESDTALDTIVTAHTLDDQAETVLMRLIRGAGTRGLGGIHPRVQVEDAQGEISGEIVRPLLGVRRPEIEAYLRSLGQQWREDSSNKDMKHTRNRVRRVLMPVLESEFNPAMAQSLSELSEIARSEEDYWENEIAGWMGTVVQWIEPDWAKKPALVQIGASADSSDEPDTLNALLDAPWFLTEPVAVQRRVLKAIGDLAGIPLQFRHIEEMRRVAEASAVGKHLQLPLGWRFVKEAESLAFVQPAPNTELWDYEYQLRVPGRVEITEAGMAISAIPRQNCDCNQGPDYLLDAAKVGGELVVRNWHPGDRYWPAHTKAPKKVKELLQDHNITGAKKKRLPVVACGDEIVWVPGFAVPASWQATDTANAILFRSEDLAT